MSARCDRCGKFVRTTFPVYGPLPQNGPSHDACEQCDPLLVARMVSGEAPPTTCQHCSTWIRQLPNGHWVDGEGFGACVKGGLWRDPLTDEVMRRPAVEHTPMPTVVIESS
jgi:hypothetical protein